MYPETLFVILDYQVNLYRLILIVDFAVLLPLAWRLARERSVQKRVVFLGWGIAIGSALLGGYTLPHIAYAYDQNLPYSWSLGAIIAVAISLSAYALWLGKRVANRRETFDILAPCIAFAFALGRLACFAAGCCNGKPAEGVPWAVTFTDPASASNYLDIPIHPTQLYESAGCLLILILLLVMFNRPNLKGTLIWVFFLCYGLLRFANEFFRGDTRTMVGVLSLNQWVCLVASVTGCVIVFIHLAQFGSRRVVVAG